MGREPGCVRSLRPISNRCRPPKARTPGRAIASKTRRASGSSSAIIRRIITEMRGGDAGIGRLPEREPDATDQEAAEDELSWLGRLRSPSYVTKAQLRQQDRPSPCCRVDDIVHGPDGQGPSADCLLGFWAGFGRSSSGVAASADGYGFGLPDPLGIASAGDHCLFNGVGVQLMHSLRMGSCVFGLNGTKASLARAPA